MNYQTSIFVDYGKAASKHTHRGVLIGLGIGIAICLIFLALV